MLAVTCSWVVKCNKRVEGVFIYLEMKHRKTKNCIEINKNNTRTKYNIKMLKFLHFFCSIFKLKWHLERHANGEQKNNISTKNR